MELTNSLVANPEGVGVGNDDYDDLFREEEDTWEEGNIDIPRPAKKSRAETKQMSNDELFLYFQELLEVQAMVSFGNVNCSCLKLLKEDDGVCAVCKVFDWVWKEESSSPG
jgi:hypothetical protein